MSDEELEVILAELRQVRQAIKDAVAEIVEQESEIQALHWLLRHKGIVTQEELAAAGEEGARRVDSMLQPTVTNIDSGRRAQSKRVPARSCYRGKRRGMEPPRMLRP